MQIDPEFSQALRKYFTFSRKEYKAALALLFITTIIWFFCDIKNLISQKPFNNSLIIEKAKTLDDLNSRDLSSKDNDIGSYPEKDNSDDETNNTTLYFPFNPNTASNEEFEKLGLSNKQIRIIQNYRSKVGEIKSKADFKKIYSIKKTQFEALSPYITLPENNSIKEFVGQPPKNIEKKKLTIEINTADSATLDLLPGIGMGYARRIIKYRVALGGFVSLSQLIEVYGFRATLLDSITPFLTIDISKITTLNINSGNIEELRKHPYLRYKIANAIVNYQQQHGNFKQIDDLKNVILVTTDIYEKIKYYVSVE